MNETSVELVKKNMELNFIEVGKEEGMLFTLHASRLKSKVQECVVQKNTWAHGQ